MNTTESQIFSSTGDLGTSRRQDERLYRNAETAYAKKAVAEFYFMHLPVSILEDLR